MNYHHSDTRVNRGIAPLVIMLIVAAVLAVAAGGYIIATRTNAGKKLVSKIEQAKPGSEQKAGGETAGQPTGSAATGVDSIQVAAPSFDFSFSPVPSLNASAFNVGSPYVGSAASAFSGLNFKTDLSVDTTVNVALPEINADELKPKTLAQPVTQPVTQPPSGGQNGAVTQANCAQFAAMPSAQYCSQVGDANGRTLCEQCKAAGY